MGRVRARMRQLYSTILVSRSDARGEFGDHVPPRVVVGGGVVRSGDVHDPFEQAAFAAEGEVDGLGGDAGVVGDGGDGGAGVAVVDEESAGGLEDPAAGLFGPDRRAAASGRRAGRS